MFLHFRDKYGKQINKCEVEFNNGDIKGILLSISKNLHIQPEEFLNDLLVKSSTNGCECFKDDKEERLRIYDQCVLIAKKYKILKPEEVEALINIKQSKKGFLNKIKSIFK